MGLNVLKTLLADEPQDLVEEAQKKAASVTTGGKPSKPKFKKLASLNDTLNLNKLDIIRDLHRGMANFSPDRPYKNLHASDVTNQELEFCPRERALLIETKAEPNEKYIATQTQLYFDVGEAFHDLVREKWGAKISFGIWHCQKCDHKTEPNHKPPKCPSCGCKDRLKYEELRVLSQVSGISCGIDWMVLVPCMKGKVEIVEIKSMNGDDFKALEHPLAEHVLRTRIYLHSLATSVAELGFNVETEYAHVLYVSKGAYVEGEYETNMGFIEKRTPFKQYKIQRSDAKAMVYIQKGVAFNEYRKTKELPCRLCKTPISKRAKECSMAKTCWGTKK